MSAFEGKANIAILRAYRIYKYATLIRHDLGDAEQHDGCQEKQIDIGFDLAVAPQHGHVVDRLLLQGRLRASFRNQREETTRLDLEPLDAPEEKERAQCRGRTHARIDQD